MKTSTSLIAAVTCGLALACGVKADTLALYTFDTITAASSGSNDANALSVASSITAGSGAGMVAVANTTWSADPVAAMTNLSSSKANAISGNDYWDFTLTVNDGYTMSLDSLSLNALLNDNVTSVAGSLFFQYKPGSASSYTDVGDSGYLIGGNSTTTTVPTSVSLSLAASAFQDLDDSITFRVYGIRSSGSIRIDDITLNGAITAIPEPSSLALLASLVTLGCAATRRRR